MTSPLALITAAIVAWLLIGGAGIVQPRNLRVVRLLFMLGAFPVYLTFEREYEKSQIPNPKPQIPNQTR